MIATNRTDSRIGIQLVVVCLGFVVIFFLFFTGRAIIAEEKSSSFRPSENKRRLFKFMMSLKLRIIGLYNWYDCKCVAFIKRKTSSAIQAWNDLANRWPIRNLGLHSDVICSSGGISYTGV